ncbi:hypothetical protein PT2222_80211 [Paraburkholderia tropica]
MRRHGETGCACASVAESAVQPVELDAGVDEDIADIGNEFGDEGDQREQKERAEHDGVIAADHRVVRKLPHAIERKERFDQQVAVEKGAHECGGQTGDERNRRVAQHVLPEHVALGRALRARGQHVLAADFLEEGVLREDRDDREVAHHRSRDRQHHVPQIIEHLADRAEVVEVVGGEAAHRKHLPEGAAAEHHQQQHAEHEAGNRVAREHQHARDGVEARAVAHGFRNAKRHRDQIREDHGPQAERDRHRQLLANHLPHARVLIVRLAEIEGGVVLEHHHVARERRFIEAELLLDLLDLLRVHALAAVIPAAARAHFAAARAAAVTQLREHLFDRTARHELRDDERDRDHADERRHHQQKTSENIGVHAAPYCTAAVWVDEAPPARAGSGAPGLRYQ